MFKEVLKKKKEKQEQGYRKYKTKDVKLSTNGAQTRVFIKSALFQLISINTRQMCVCFKQLHICTS